MSHTVTAILVSFRHGAVIARAVRSLERLRGDLVQVLVVDNANDLGAEIQVPISGLVPAVLVPGHNLGFAAAVNLAARQARGRLLMLLSPDAEVVSWSSAGIARELADDVGAIGAFTLDRQGRPSASWGEFPGAGRVVRRLTGIGRRRRRAVLEQLAAGRVQTVEWVLGAALVIRREVLDSVGGLDEACFAAGEDQDLAGRLRDRGLRCVVSPAWQVRHEPRDPRSMLAAIRLHDRRFVSTYGGVADRLAWRLVSLLRGPSA